MVVTQFIPVSGAAPGRGRASSSTTARAIRRASAAGPDPTIAAAGDISCTRTRRCHDDETSACSSADPPTRVLTLGDNQYESGELANFQTYYEPDWGRLKSITMPSPGNHDPPSSGYGAYFGDAGQLLVRPRRMAPDLARLDRASRPPPRSSTSDLANRTNRCILAYWHHPRFSSGATHGNNSAIGAVLGPAVRGRAPTSC